MYIANGRICDDKEGKRTCNDLSVIDYFILKSDVFTLVKEFKIMDFDPSLSNVHCGIHISLSCTDTGTEETIPANSERFHARWQQEKCDEFVNNTNIDNVENISEILRILDVPNDMVSKDIVDSAVDALGKIFLESANKTFGEYSKTVKTNVIRSGNIVGKNKPWFNKNCKEKRNNFLRARKRYNLFKNQGTKADMNSFSKEYKRALYDAYGKYQKDFANDIRKMSNNNPKSFWNLLNRYTRSGADKSPVPIQEFYEFFKTCNQQTFDDENVHFDPGIDNDFLREQSGDILNCEITEQEIHTVVSKLQNHKAAGQDGILNEY